MILVTCFPFVSDRIGRGWDTVAVVWWLCAARYLFFYIYFFAHPSFFPYMLHQVQSIQKFPNLMSLFSYPFSFFSLISSIWGFLSCSFFSFFSSFHIISPFSNPFPLLPTPTPTPPLPQKKLCFIDANMERARGCKKNEKNIFSNEKEHYISWCFYYYFYFLLCVLSLYLYFFIYCVSYNTE